MALWIVSGVCLCVSLLALVLAVRAVRISESKGPAKWNTRLAEAVDELTAVQDRLEAMSDLLKKRSARTAGRARWDRNEPDPAKDPEAWKRWANSADGLASMRTRN